jgi:hypothetical protein
MASGRGDCDSVDLLPPDSARSSYDGVVENRRLQVQLIPTPISPTGSTGSTKQKLPPLKALLRGAKLLLEHPPPALCLAVLFQNQILFSIMHGEPNRPTLKYVNNGYSS